MNEQAQAIIDQFQEKVDKYVSGHIDPRFKGAITGTLEKTCGGKENRYRILKMLTGRTSSKELSDAHWDALNNLVMPFKPEGGKWSSGNPELESICNILLNADMDQEGQSRMWPLPDITESPIVRSKSEHKQEFESPWPVPENDDIPF